MRLNKAFTEASTSMHVWWTQATSFAYSAQFEAVSIPVVESYAVDVINALNVNERHSYES
jgi:hypothetical protein